MRHESTATPGPPARERRTGGRGRLRRVPDALYAILRFIARRIRGFWGALAAFLTIGMAVGAVAAALFATFAAIVQGGFTQALDERALTWIAGHRSPALDRIMLEITSLGNGAVLVLLVAIASVFLWLTNHRWSVYILFLGVLGGKLLNTVLKETFDRARPSVIEHVDVVMSKSFPSGHAMSSFIVYATVAYLVSRLEPSARLRRTTWCVAILLILAVGVSRMYLGVHYPSDVIGGYIAGLAWVMFVSSSITAVRFFAPRRPQTHAEEHDLDAERGRATP